MSHTEPPNKNSNTICVYNMNYIKKNPVTTDLFIFIFPSILVRHLTILLIKAQLRFNCLFFSYLQVEYTATHICTYVVDLSVITSSNINLVSLYYRGRWPTATSTDGFISPIHVYILSSTLFWLLLIPEHNIKSSRKFISGVYIHV